MGSNTENGMLHGAQDALDDRAAHADREARAFEMFCREFLDAIREGADEPVSWYEQRVPVGYALGELFAEPKRIAEFIAVLQHDGDTGLHLASVYASEQVAYYVNNGGL